MWLVSGTRRAVELGQLGDADTDLFVFHVRTGILPGQVTSMVSSRGC